MYLTTTYNYPSCLLARAKEIEKFVQDIPAVCARVPSPIGILQSSEYLEHALGFWLRWDYVAEMNLFLPSLFYFKGQIAHQDRGIHASLPSFERAVFGTNMFGIVFCWLIGGEHNVHLTRHVPCPCKRNALEWWERWWSTISHSILQPLLSAASEFNCFKATLKSSSCIAVQCPYVLSVLKRP